MTAPATRFSRLEPDRRRAEILRAAYGQFVSKPYEAVALADVAADAGVTRGLVHHYFGGKRELYLAVLRTLAAVAPLAVRTDLDLPREEMVAANVDSWLDGVGANREAAGALMAFGGAGQDPEVHAVVDGIRDRLAERIAVNHYGTADVPPAVRLALRGYVGLAEAAIAEWLVHGRATRDEVHDLMTRALLAIVRDVAPA